MLIVRYESDRFSMCSEKITHLEARKMLSESEQMFSAMISALDQEPEDSFLLNERRMQEQNSGIGESRKGNEIGSW